MALWCRSLPLVTVPRGTTPKCVTLVVPFYENQRFFEDQVQIWRQWAEALRPYVSAVIVDDGSPRPAVLPSMLPFLIRLFRIEVDCRWNWLAARNIGAHHAADGWLLLTDMDHVIPEDTLRSTIYGQHDPAVVYAFSRREHTGEVLAPHSASFLMTRTMFWRIGGYDETFSGWYGTDGLYRRRVAATAPIQVQTEPLIRYEYVVDSSTVRYGRKEKQDGEVRRLAAKLPRHHRPKTLTFAYHEVRA